MLRSPRGFGTLRRAAVRWEPPGANPHARCPAIRGPGGSQRVNVRPKPGVAGRGASRAAPAAPSRPGPSPWPARVTLVVVLAATALVFGAVGGFDFVMWDDLKNVVENPHLQLPLAASLPTSGRTSTTPPTFRSRGRCGRHCGSCLRRRASSTGPPWRSTWRTSSWCSRCCESSRSARSPPAQGRSCSRCIRFRWSRSRGSPA